MKEKKRNKSSTQESVEVHSNNEMEAFAAILAESGEEHFNGNLEPFEEYVQLVKEKIYGETSLFCLRFSKGYSVLLEELNRDQTKQPPSPE